MRILIIRMLANLLGLLPARALVALSHPLGRLGWRLGKTKRNSTERNLAACFPEWDEAQRDRVARESMRHYMMIVLETGVCWSWSQRRIEEHFTEPRGIEFLDAALAEGRGVLVLAPHFGNWELLNHWVQFRHPLTALYKAGADPAIEAALVANRRRFGAGMVPTTAAGIKQLYREARSGSLVAILPDQDPSGGAGRFAPFFGVPALTAVLATRMVQQTGCRVVFGACARLPGGRYRTHFQQADPEIYSDDADVSLAALNRGVEQVVAIDPPQYLWAYKRFKSRPPGEPRFY